MMLKKRYDTSNYEVDRPLSKGMNKKVIGLMKDELGVDIITEFVAVKAKTNSYLTDYGNNDKKGKGTKKNVIKRYVSLMIIKTAYLRMKLY